MALAGKITPASAEGGNDDDDDQKKRAAKRSSQEDSKQPRERNAVLKITDKTFLFCFPHNLCLHPVEQDV